MLELFQVITFINAATMFTFGLLIFIKNKKTECVKAFMLFSLSFSVWMFAFSFQIAEKDYEQSMMWSKIFMLGSTFIAPSFFYFITSILNLKMKKIIILFYAIGFFLSLGILTPFYIDHLQPKLIFHWWLVPGYIFHVQFFVTEIIYGLGFFLFFKNYKKIDWKTSKQSQGLIIGAAIALVGGSSNYFVCYDIHIMPYLNFIIPLQLIIYLCYIMKYNIMNVRDCFLKGIFSYIIFTIIFSIPLFATFIFETWIKEKTGIDSIWIVISIIVLFLALIFKNTFVIGELESQVEKRTNELKQANDELGIMNDRLVETRDQLWGEMQLAKKIQTVLLPENPYIDTYEVSAYMEPASDVGGDYYDIIHVDGRDWIVIGDVSGHGVPAGLIMMMVQTSIHTVLEQNPNIYPSELLEIVNRTIHVNIKHLGDDKYMTITVLLHENGKYLFAGLHQDILIYRYAERKVESIETDGMWVGIMDQIDLQDYEFNLQKNDVLLLYTDGITEASHPNGEMYGQENLRKVLVEYGNYSTKRIEIEILASLQEYQKKDDVTFMLLKRE
jgi:serine phosphatase RsbU (regulator of sigma subunit)